MKEHHKTQMGMLKNLLFASNLRFNELKPDPNIENNTFTFHLDSLIAEGLVTKNEQYYQLTDLGKEVANRMDTDTLQKQIQAKISAWCCCIRNTETGRQVLIGKRMKQPFYGCQGFVAGKVRFGETLIDAAKRELSEEAGLTGEPELVQIRHYITYKNNELVEDKFMHLFLFTDPQGELTNNNEVELEWIDIQDIKEKIIKPFGSLQDLQEIIKIANEFDGNLSLVEIVENNEKF